MLKIQGNSGCKIEILSSDNGTFVRKHSSSPDYNKRLLKQSQKQSSYLEKSGAKCLVPKVFNAGEDYFDMELFHGMDVISYIDICGKNDIDQLFDVLIKIITANIQACSFETFNKEKFLEKFYGVKESAKSLGINVEKVEGFFERLPEEEIPAGVCHGDLTLSNVLISKSGLKVCLIDFLDTFYETPVQDMVKLRQDSRYMWSSLLYNHKYDSIRHKSVMNYLDLKLVDNFSQYGFYRTYYKPFQMMNFLRILPYAKDSIKKEFVKRKIREMMSAWI